jgi:hypothetical protein
MKQKKEMATDAGPARTRSGLTKWFAYAAAALLLCAAAVLLYGWAEAGRHKPVIRPIATAEALLGSLPRSEPPVEAASGEEAEQSAVEETVREAEPEPEPKPEPRARAVVAPKPSTKPPPKLNPPAAGDRALAVGLFRSQSNRIEAERMLEGMSLPYYHKKSWKADQTHLLSLRAADSGILDASADAMAAAGYDFDRTPDGLTAYFFDDDDARAALAVIAKAGGKATVTKKTDKAPRWSVYCGPLTAEEADGAARRLAGKGIKVLRTRYEP